MAQKKPYGFIIPTLNLSFLEKFIGLDCPLVKNEKIWLLSCARPYLKKIGWGTKKNAFLWAETSKIVFFKYIFDNLPGQKLKDSGSVVATRALAIHEFCTLLEFRLRNKTIFAKCVKVVLVPIISKCMWLYTTPWQRPTYKVVSLLTRVVLSQLVG